MATPMGTAALLGSHKCRELPLTAVAMVIGIGGPSGATWTCLATVGVAALAGIGAGSVLDKLTRRYKAPSLG